MVDSRIELFDQATWDAYLTITGGGPAALEALAQVRATVVVVDPSIQPDLGAALRGAASRWVVAFEDTDGALFVLRP